MTSVSPPQGVPDTSSSIQTQRGAPLPHLPALDGVRGLAVIGVLLFHGGFAWAKGGFLGVSTFFTLSGFLITNLLVREWERSTTLDLIRFWGRRLRRLLPAAVAAIAIIGLIWWRIGSPEQLSSLRFDMLSAVGYIANWRLWSSGVSYGSLFTEPTPFQHFWSLAIEEQFYLVFPLVVLVLTRLGGRRLLTIVCAGAAVVSIALMWFQRSDFDRVYYGTDTRIAEILFGVLLALWWSSRSRTSTQPTAREPLFDIAGIFALLGILAAWWSVAESSRGLARGGLPLYALLSTVIIYCATRAGFFARLFSASALRWAGLLSYGLYLYHWPIFLLLSPERTGLALAPLFVLRMIVTIGVALISYFLLEMPVRRRTLFVSPRSAGTAALVSIATVAIFAVASTAALQPTTIPYANMKVGSVEITTVALNPSTTSANQTASTVWIIGDSGAMDQAPALAAAFEGAGSTRFIFGAGPGFGLSIPGINWRQDWDKVIARDKPQLAVLMFGSWDLPFIKENGEAAYERLVEEAVTKLTESGIHVMLLPVMPGGKLDVSAVDRVFAKVAARHQGMVDSPSITSAFVAPDGSYARYWIGTDGTVHLLRKDDNWHLCQEGASNLAELISDRAAQLGWSAPVTTSWKSGAWQQAWQFSDPVGACDGI